VIAYDSVPSSTALPTLAHLSVAPATPPAKNVTTHVYAGTQHGFYDPYKASFKPGPAAQSHTRTVEFLKKHLGGPYFDLESIWEEHCRYEFEVRRCTDVSSVYVLIATPGAQRCEVHGHDGGEYLFLGW
jgi:carboxymethylenebutenolidase